MYPYPYLNPYPYPIRIQIRIQDTDTNLDTDTDTDTVSVSILGIPYGILYIENGEEFWNTAKIKNVQNKILDNFSFYGFQVYQKIWNLVFQNQKWQVSYFSINLKTIKGKVVQNFILNNFYFLRYYPFLTVLEIQHSQYITWSKFVNLCIFFMWKMSEINKIYGFRKILFR